jgi:hypothetical protein
MAVALAPSMGRLALAAPTLLPAGCHADWPVIAHHAGRAPVSGLSLPVACAAETGVPTSETSIAVSNSGAVIFSPAQTENTVARSASGDGGWSLVAPAGAQQSTLFNTVDPQVIVDRDTGRLFWVHATGPDRTVPGVIPGGLVPPGSLLPFVPAYGFQVYRSTDDGRSFTTADYQTAPMGDWEKIFVGPPTSAGPRPQGYPNVVYVCANSPLEASGPSRLCYRSLDGGVTFSPDGYVLAPGATRVCPPLGANTGVVDSHGTTFQPESCQDGAYLAVSTDEGATYTWSLVPTAPPNPNLTGGNIQLAMDAADNLYVCFLQGDELMLTISRDHARNWSTPVSVTAPGVHGLLLPAMAAGPAGSVGLTYYGRTGTATTGPESAYITQTSDALDSNPLFFSGPYNDPAHPIYFAGGLTTYPRADYVGGAFDSSGQFWAAVTKQSGPPDSNNNVKTSGYIGRLVTVVAAASRTGGAAAGGGGLPDTTAGNAAPVALVVAMLVGAVGVLLRRRPVRTAG